MFSKPLSKWEWIGAAAGSFGLTVFGLAQIKRAVKKREDEKERTDDLKAEDSDNKDSKIGAAQTIQKEEIQKNVEDLNKQLKDVDSLIDKLK